MRSPDGLVEVVVTAGGAITDVRFLGPLHGRTRADVAGSVQAAVTAAADAAEWAREKLHNETFARLPAARGGLRWSDAATRSPPGWTRPATR